MITEKFNRALTEYNDLTDLVGARISRAILPQNTAYPALSFLNFSAPSINTLTAESSLKRALIQVDVWAKTPVQAADVAREVRNAVAAFVEFKSLPMSQRDEPYEPDAKAYRISIDFSVWSNDEV